MYASTVKRDSLFKLQHNCRRLLLAVWPIIFLTTCSCLFFSGCSTAASKSQARTKPPALVDTTAFPVQYQAAAQAVALSISQAGEDPKEFFAEVGSENDGRVLVFHLWHLSAFEPQYKLWVGNPGGKCRDVMYDAEARKVTQTLFWQ
jgi:hypothetical protein